MGCCSSRPAREVARANQDAANTKGPEPLEQDNEQNAVSSQEPADANAPQEKTTAVQQNASNDAPKMRLLLAKRVATWEHAPPYEAVDGSDYIDCSVEEFLSTYAPRTAAISWRWAAPKPKTLDAAKGAEGNAVVPTTLLKYIAKWPPIVGTKTDGNDDQADDTSAAGGSEQPVEYLWLDWSCVPQYQDPETTMREINRSGMYYREAGQVLFWCFRELVPEREHFTMSDYFARAWTLAERLHRSRGKHAVTAASILPVWLRPDHDRFMLYPEEQPNGAGAVAGEENGEDGLGQWLPKCQELVRLCSQALRNGGVFSASSLDAIRELVTSRYEKLDQLAKVLRGPVKSLVDPATAVALLNAVEMRAFAEWTKADVINPQTGDMKDSLLMSIGVRPIDLKVSLLNDLFNAWRMALNNLNQGEAANDSYWAMTKMQDDGITITMEIQRAAKANDVEAGKAAIQRLRQLSADLWSKALMRPITEKADSLWLRRYLTFDAGDSYKAWMPADLLFAVYKLFDIPDGKYGDETRIWTQMASLAGMEMMSPYAWLRNLSRPGDFALESASFFGVSSHEAPVATSAPNFSVFGFGHENASDVESAGAPVKQALIASGAVKEALLAHAGQLTFDGADQAKTALEQVFKEDDHTVTYLCAGRLDAGQGYRLSRSQLSRVDLAQGGEIDQHISLRGRRALSLFEEAVHNTIHRVASEAPKSEDGNLIVLCVKYHDLKCLPRALVLWANECAADDPSTKEWNLEVVAGLGGPAQKGSSWGVANIVQNLAKDLLKLTCEGGRVALDYDCKSSQFTEIVEPKLEGVSGQEQSWWSETRLGIKTRPAAANVPEPGALPAGGSSLMNSMMAALLGGGADPAMLAMMAGALPSSGGSSGGGGKTAFSQEDLDRAESAFKACKEDLSPANAQKYLGTLSSNYVHDREMAKHLDYYADYCSAVARHIKELPGLIGSVSDIKSKLNYLIEDLGDAIEMAEDSPHAGAAKQALQELKTACSEAGL